MVWIFFISKYGSVSPLMGPHRGGMQALPTLEHASVYNPPTLINKIWCQVSEMLSSSLYRKRGRLPSVSTPLEVNQ
jgi:hypothetical protein